MSHFAIKHVDDDQATVYFDIEADEVMTIGAEMESMNEQAYMNGYNWDAFLNYYLQINHPELLEGLDTDPEAGTFVAFYAPLDADKADKLTALINELIDSPDKVYHFLGKHGDAIEWD